MIIEENDVIDYLGNCSVDEIVSIIVSATGTFLEDEQIARGILAHCADFDQDGQTDILQILEGGE